MISGSSNCDFDLSFKGNNTDVASFFLNVVTKSIIANPITPCGIGALQRDVGLDEDIRNYSRGMVTPRKIKSHIGWENFKGVKRVLSPTLIHF